jgi:hypothetical protein
LRRDVEFDQMVVRFVGHPIFKRMHKPTDEKRMAIILDENEYDDYLSCPVKDAKKYFRQWHGALEDFPNPTSPRAPRADSRTVIPPKPKGDGDDLFA